MCEKGKGCASYGLTGNEVGVRVREGVDAANRWLGRLHKWSKHKSLLTTSLSLSLSAAADCVSCEAFVGENK